MVEGVTDGVRDLVGVISSPEHETHMARVLHLRMHEKRERVRTRRARGMRPLHGAHPARRPAVSGQG